MKTNYPGIGTRALTSAEFEAVLACMQTDRDRILMLTLYYTGFRISEALSLTAADCARGRMTVQARNMKGRERTRSVLMPPRLRDAVYAYIGSHSLAPAAPLFSRACSNAPKDAPISRIWAHKVLKEAVHKLGLQGKVALHSTRKSFAHTLYAHFDKDLVKTAQALGHTSVLSTAAYLQTGQAEIDAAISSAIPGARKPA